LIARYFPSFVNLLTNLIEGEDMSNKEHKKEIVFFVDKEKFKTTKTELSVREILQDFAEEDPNETKLVLRKGNDQHTYIDLNELIPLKNGMKFIVLHDGPTTVSWWG
jgi:hypothetical protein